MLTEAPKIPKGKRILSPSELTCYRGCRQKWFYSYIERRPYKTAGEAQRVGLIVHAGLAAWYEGNTLARCHKAIAAESKKRAVVDKVKTKAVLTLAMGIFEHYIEYYADDLNKFEPVNIERKITESSILLKCIPDLVVKIKDEDTYLIIDHKVQAKLEINKTFDAQKIALYKVLSETYPISGIIYNLILRKVPTMPEITVAKDRLKKFNPASTTEDMFKAALKKGKFKASDYKEAVKYYKKQKDSDFFKRIPVRITKEEIDAFEQESEVIQEQMKTGIIYKSRQWNCATNCDYYEDCYATDSKSPKVL